MSHAVGAEPISDDEVLFRRVPVSMGWCTSAGISPLAFDPRPDDLTGISLSRAKYKSAQEAGRGRSKSGYYIAVLIAGDLRRAGIDVVPRPLPDDAGHAEILNIHSANRTSLAAQEVMVQLVALVARVEGPFISSAAT